MEKRSISLHLYKRLRVILLTAFLVCCGLVSMSQQRINGTVSDSRGNPVSGANIEEKGKNNVVVTGTNGAFTITVSPDATLQVSHIGFVTKEVAVANQTQLQISLEDQNQEMNQVVVIGYGTVRKKDLTGAVSVIKGDALRDRNSQDVISSMRGLASGVKITSSGLPGQSASIVIRGLGSLTNNYPLFVIDGIIGGEAHLNPADIESIQVLKDASSAAIYGSRAANGVIIITTKQGREGPVRVQADANLTLEWLPRYDLMDATTWKQFDDMAYDEAIRSGVAGVTKRQNHYDANTDWQNEMLKTGILQNYNVSLSGGSKNGKYFVSLNRLDDEGALYHTGYDRYGVRVNTSGQKGIFSYGQTFLYTRTNRQNLNGNPWADFIAISPTIPVKDPLHPGGYGYGDPDKANNYGRNLVGMQDLFIQKNPENVLKGNIYGQLSLFNKMVDAKLNVAYINYSGTTNTLRKKGNWTMGQGSDAAYLGYNNYRSDDILIEQTYNFKRKFDKHDVNALGGITYNTFKGQTNWTTKLDPLVIGDTYITSLDAATGSTTGGSSYQKAALISYLGRVNYSYADKYLAQVTMRRDGTSRLPQNNRWGNFASYSLGWRISSEKFFNVPFINDLKLRANHGTLGNSNIGFWDYQAVINTAPRAVFGVPETRFIGMTQSQLTNIDLVWERKTMTNIGIDAAMLKNRLNVSIEYFRAKSKDLLVYLPILMSSGNEGGNPAVNAGSLANKGIEIEAGWRDRIGNDFSYNVSLNVSRVRNEVLDLGYGKTVYYEFLSKAAIGQPLGMFYLYKMLGIFQTDAEIQAYKNKDGKIIQPNAKPGDIKYDDFNGDGIISSDDRQIVGNPWPKFEAGLNMSATYKAFDLAINGYGRFKYDVWNGSAAAAADFANNQNNFNGIVPWTTQNPVKDRPRIVFGDTRNSRGDQDRWLEDGTFFRISQIALGYTVPERLTKKIGIERLRAGATLTNLITFTKYSGLDPEFRDAGIFTMGADNASFPNPRSVLFSLSFTF
ncbi:MAG TPA: TonB-dependent receptor [Flavisolibacter sp.]|nr:TonB-dependent receptor [Flavisolibacter sp.]